jgi:hypothetical protein
MNMNKEYRKELKRLRAESRQIERAFEATLRDADRILNKTSREQHQRKLAAVRQCNRLLTKLARRIAVLEGRLA